jgi:hypothetical protein
MHSTTLVARSYTATSLLAILSYYRAVWPIFIVRTHYADLPRLAAAAAAAAAALWFSKATSINFLRFKMSLPAAAAVLSTEASPFRDAEDKEVGWCGWVVLTNGAPVG